MIGAFQKTQSIPSFLAVHRGMFENKQPAPTASKQVVVLGLVNTPPQLA